MLSISTNPKAEMDFLVFFPLLKPNLSSESNVSILYSIFRSIINVIIFEAWGTKLRVRYCSNFLFAEAFFGNGTMTHFSDLLVLLLSRIFHTTGRTRTTLNSISSEVDCMSSTQGAFRPLSFLIVESRSSLSMPPLRSPEFTCSIISSNSPTPSFPLYSLSRRYFHLTAIFPCPCKCCLLRLL